MQKTMLITFALFSLQFFNKVRDEETFQTKTWPQIKKLLLLTFELGFE